MLACVRPLQDVGRDPDWQMVGGKLVYVGASDQSVTDEKVRQLLGEDVIERKREGMLAKEQQRQQQGQQQGQQGRS